MTIVDTHCHIFDPARFPYAPDTPYAPAGQERGTLAAMRAVFAAQGVTHALLVQPNSGYGHDNACMLDAIARSAGRWRGIAVVQPGASLAELQALKAQGIVGVAFNLPFYPPGHYDDHRPLIEKLIDLDMVLQLQTEGDGFAAVAPLIEGLPVRLLIDHCGRPDTARAPQDQPGFAALLRLGATRAEETVVKLSGYHKFAADPAREAAPHVAALLAAFGAERCLWGSDWPFLRVGERMDYGPLLDLAARLIPDPAARARVLGENALRLYFG